MLYALALIAAAGGLALAYASIVERNWFALRRHTIPCLPRGSAPLRVLHVSDLHLLARQRHKQRFLASLVRVEPHLVVGTGDFLGEPGAVEAVVETLGGLRGSIASLCVFGSHDYFGPKAKNPLRYFRRRLPLIVGPDNRWEDLARGLEARGWQFLRNQSTRVVWGGAAAGEIDVVGLDDAHIDRADFSAASARREPGFRLGIAHSPDVAPELARLGYDLILCGHTHGGQVRVPGIGALVTNSSLPRAMARGAHRIGDTWLHVSAGLGTSKYAPIRFACRPEACVLELVARA